MGEPRRMGGERSACGHPSRRKLAHLRRRIRSALGLQRFSYRRLGANSNNMTAPEPAFCQDFHVADDGAVAFRCSDDDAAWPWLRLHPASAIPIQMLNYYALTEAGAARGDDKGEGFSALTRLAWRTYQAGPGARRAHHGLLDPPPADGGPDFVMTLFDERGRLLYRFAGAGVVFRNRDFKAWRAKSKEKALAEPEPKDFPFAAPAAVGVESKVEAIVSPLDEDDGAEALVTARNGFPPGHPYHDGSGDHVNSGHLADAAAQVAHQIRMRGRAPTGYIAGAVQFDRYVELERPFRIARDWEEARPNALRFNIEQAGERCSTVAFFYADG